MNEATSALWPVYEFRPLPDAFREPPLRYAGGLWIPDDGEYDLAFSGKAKEGYPKALYVALPYQRNIVCSWLTTHWSARVPEHPRGNSWHYALRAGATEWGGDWNSDRHENSMAGRACMDKTASLYRCANGVHIEMKPNDPHIAAGLLRERDTKAVFSWPEGLFCMYCSSPATVKP